MFIGRVLLGNISKMINAACSNQRELGRNSVPDKYVNQPWSKKKKVGGDTL